MKRLICVLLLLIFSLFSCGNNQYVQVSGESSKATMPENDNRVVYVANVKSQKYHLKTCYTLEGASAEHLTETTDIDLLVNRGYTPCSKCMPQ